MDEKTEAPQSNEGVDRRIAGEDWAAVENHLKKHDGGLVKNFDDDINTLLVFAGLFSAVLTAFVIESFKWLQQDSSETSAQLLAQLVALQTTPSTNASHAPQPLPFRPAGSAVLINSLWFLSLILSLASALFGMITKQWLREYMQWTSMSSLPEELVRLRQGRYEAFQTWGVPAIIAMIPTLLEVALIMFFIGLVNLLWTLDPIVAIVGTFAVVILVALAIVATVLPIFSLKCSYKSPTGWAVLQAGWLVARLWNRLVVNLDASVQSGLGIDLTIKVQTYTDWRARDLDIQRRWNGLNAEILVSNGILAGVERLREKDVKAEAGLIYSLTRCLTWIQKTSQDTQLLAHVARCWSSRMSTKCDALSLLIIDFHVSCKLLDLDVSTTYRYIDKCCARLFDPIPSSRMSYFFRLWDLEAGFRSDFSAEEYGVHERLRVGIPPLLKAQAANLLALDLAGLLDRLSDGTAHTTDEIAVAVMRSLALSSLLMLSSVVQTESTDHRCVESLVVLFQRCCRHPGIKEYLPILPITLLQALTECEVRLGRGAVMFTTPSNDITCADLALEVLAVGPAKWRKVDCDLFVRLALQALKDWKREHALLERKVALHRLLGRMAMCVEYAFAMQWIYCGSYNVPVVGWVIHMHHIFHPRGKAYHRHMDDIYPHSLVHWLMRCRDSHLADDLHSVSLDVLLRRSHELQRTGSGELCGPDCDIETVKHPRIPPLSSLYPPFIVKPQSVVGTSDNTCTPSSQSTLAQSDGPSTSLKSLPPPQSPFDIAASSLPRQDTSIGSHIVQASLAAALSPLAPASMLAVDRSASRLSVRGSAADDRASLRSRSSHDLQRAASPPAQSKESNEFTRPADALLNIDDDAPVKLKLGD